MNEREIFLAALELKDAEERRQLVESACAGNAPLLAAVKSLFASMEAAADFLEKPAVQPIANLQSAEKHKSSTTSEASDPTVLFSPEQRAMNSINDDFRDERIPLGFLLPSDRNDSFGRVAHYEVLEVLGQGGFGTVLKAFDDKLHRMVAIKVMKSDMAVTSPARKRFLREARAVAAVRHENVVAIHAVEAEPIPYLVMEYIPGKTLADVLKQSGPLDLADVLDVGAQIAAGLGAAHARKIVHRDVKPSNILLEDGIIRRIKITDFGLARTVDDANESQSSHLVGTPNYMSPEQVQNGHIDLRSDLFSFGTVLYQMITGRAPFRAQSVREVMNRIVNDTPRPIRDIIPETPKWLCDIVCCLHAQRPEDRIQTVDEVAALLRQQDSGFDDARESLTRPKLPARLLWLSAAGLAAASAVITSLLINQPPAGDLDSTDMISASSEGVKDSGDPDDPALQIVQRNPHGPIQKGDRVITTAYTDIFDDKFLTSAIEHIYGGTEGICLEIYESDGLRRYQIKFDITPEEPVWISDAFVARLTSDTSEGKSLTATGK